MHDDFESCYRAVSAKDARFDGWFVTAVLTTGIYCRPSCPATTPRRRNVTFYRSVAAAQHGGFRACKRCRPDASPGSPEWNVRSDLVGRAMRLIADGTVDRDGVAGLASRLGYSTRQLERHLTAEVGAGPLALARAQRAQTARLLIETTKLPFGEVAFAAGFSSIRQFNDTVRTVFDTTPSQLRMRTTGTQTDAGPNAGALNLRLPFRQPFDPTSLFGHLFATSIPGCEEHRNGAYRRTLTLPGGTAVVTLSPRPDHIACRLHLCDVRDLHTAISRCRRLLDLDADPEAIVAALGAEPALAPLVAKVPGRRLPRSVDEHELALRVVISQQVSLTAASTHSRRLVERYGRQITDPEGGLTHVFPSVDELAELDPASLALPEARRRTVQGLIEALSDGSVELGPGTDWERARNQLAEIPGIGAWTCEMIAMRGLGDPDAFPATDLGVRRGAAALGLPDRAGRLTDHARAWRPWRSYAVQYLWAAHDGPTNRWPPTTPAIPQTTTRQR